MSVTKRSSVPATGRRPGYRSLLAVLVPAAVLLAGGARWTLALGAAGDLDGAAGVAVQKDGRIVVAGSTSDGPFSSVAVARHLGR
jgi:hypothetical protein